MAVSAGIYALMALGLNVIWGMRRLVNLGLVGFFAIGAYASRAADRELGRPIPVGWSPDPCAVPSRAPAVALSTVRCAATTSRS